MSVAVVGAGVVGLTTGVILARRGYSVTLYTAEPPPAATSSAACAIWLPFSMSDPKRGAEIDETTENRRWAEVSWREFSRLVRANCGVRRIKLVEAFDGPGDPPYYSGLVEGFESGPLAGAPSPVEHAWHMTTFVIEMPQYLAWLQNEFERLGGTIVLKRLRPRDLKSLHEPVVFNCAGLGARELTADDSLVPIKGQTLLHDPIDLPAAIGEGAFCVIPRTDALVLGSLLLEDDGTEHEDGDGSDFLWDAARRWAESPVGQRMGLPKDLSRDNVRQVVVGIRPYRPEGVRLEREARGRRTIYHNYGHGGSGVTFSWGSSTAIVEQYERRAAKELGDVVNDRSRQACDVSIEIGHVEVHPSMKESDFDALDQEMRRSAEKARRIMDALGSDESYNTVALFDDKSGQLSSRARVQLMAHLNDDALAGSLGVDFVCFESQLKTLVPQAQRLLTARAAQAMNEALERQSGLNCSHDIVLWYCLRLGILKPTQHLIRPVSKAAKDQTRPFIANRLISVLDEHVRTAEKIADDIIVSSFGPEVAGLCGRLYYNGDA